MTKRQNIRMFLPPRTKENSETLGVFFWLNHERVLWETKKISDNAMSLQERSGLGERLILIRCLGIAMKNIINDSTRKNTDIDQIVKASGHCLQFLTKNLLKMIKRFVSCKI